MIGRKLYLSDKDRKIAGVCGGLAEYFGIDSTIVRILWALAVLVSYGQASFFISSFGLSFHEKEIYFLENCNDQG